MVDKKKKNKKFGQRQHRYQADDQNQKHSLSYHKYEEECFRRAQSVILRIAGGARIQGTLNLFSELAEDVAYPDQRTAEGIADKLWDQLQHNIPLVEKLQNYNFEFSVKAQSGGYTVRFTYSPSDVRYLSPGNEDK